MPKLEWLETFELRVPEIDCDHRAMFDLIKAARAAASTGNRRRATHLLDRFVAFSQSHFEREEALLEDWGYPEAKHHGKYHAALLSQARHAATEIQTAEAFEQLCEDLMSFLVDEVVGGDMKLKSFLSNAGLALPAVPS